MIKATQKLNQHVLEVSLAGEVDDEAVFEKLIPAPSPSVKEIHLNCKEIDRINSVGVKRWVSFFSKFKASGIMLKLAECSPAIVHQLNTVMTFSCGGTVESVMATYVCDSCQHRFMMKMPTAAIIKLNFEIPDIRCEKCQGVAVFDDLPKMFFKFLRK